jgi:hypothetical protein
MPSGENTKVEVFFQTLAGTRPCCQLAVRIEKTPGKVGIGQAALPSVLNLRLQATVTSMEFGLARGNKLGTFQTLFSLQCVEGPL